MPGKALRRACTISLAAAVAVCLGAAPGAGADTVLVGSPGGGFPGGGSLINFNPGPITGANLSLGEPGAHVTSPVNGTITQWRVSAGGTGAYTLHVLRPASGGQFTEVGSSPGVVTSANTDTTFTTFSANLPIQAGDLLAADIPGFQTLNGHFGQTGSSEIHFSPAIASGATVSPDSTPDTSQEFMLNADVQFDPSGSSPPGAPGPTAKKCKKKKKHTRSASAAKKKCKKKKK
jgi:hypothetical protein